MARRRLLCVMVLAVVTTACSDAGTRVAYDIEAGVGRLGAADGSRVTIEHVPRAWPEGCNGAYTLTIESGTSIPDGHGNFRLAPGAGGLGVSCEGGGGSTTYHLRFVDVPTTLAVTKGAGESAFLDLRREAGRAVLTGLR